MASLTPETITIDPAEFMAKSELIVINCNVKPWTLRLKLGIAVAYFAKWLLRNNLRFVDDAGEPF